MSILPKNLLHGIDLTTPGGVDALLEFHRTAFGNVRMGPSDPPENQGGQQDPPAGPERPDGVSEDEWSALGDPGKAAIVRERERATAAERALAAARVARPTKTDPPKDDEKPKDQGGKDGDQPDIAALVAAAVAEAFKPFNEAQQQSAAESAARTITSAVEQAAKDRLYDPTDAITGIDLTSVTDGNGQPDTAKITTAIDDLLKRKPHLGKPADQARRTASGVPVGAGGSSQTPLDDRVKATLARMQSSAGVKFREN